MDKKIVALALLTLAFCFWAFTEPGACKDFNTSCTNGGCGKFNFSEGCKFYCYDVGDGESFHITCTTPGSQDEGTLPTTQGPGN